MTPQTSRILPAILSTLLLAACGSGNDTSRASSTSATAVINNAAANNTSPTTTGTAVPTTAISAASSTSCTPFGNPQRPRDDVLNAIETNPTLCLGGSRLTDWADNNGTTRHACLYDPGTATTTRKLPLMVFLQGSAVPSDLQLPLTNLISSLTTANLSNDSQRPGFILVQPIGRITDHYYPLPNGTQTVGWDVWYRQMSAVAGGVMINGTNYPLNPDMETIDHYIAQMVATGKVDTSRIYVVGWSNGAALALMYGQNRANVAAVAMYSGPDPYDSLNDPCGQKPVAGSASSIQEVQVSNPGITVYHIHNNCDIYATCPNALALRSKLLATGTAQIKDQIISGLPNQTAVDTCTASCGTDPRGDGSLLNLQATLIGIPNHLVWPTGWNDSIFSFLRSHSVNQ